MIDQFPHCDSFVLHKPGECEYCDRLPDWQELREAWGIAFTGHSDEITGRWGNESYNGGPVLPCPADFTRPPGTESDHRRWAGNKPTGATGDGSWPKESFASQVLYGDQGGRA